MITEAELRFIQKHVHRNPYTGSACLDLADVMSDPALRELLRSVWDAGYDAGFTDGDADSSVESATVNPYR